MICQGASDQGKEFKEYSREERVTRSGANSWQEVLKGGFRKVFTLDIQGSRGVTTHLCLYRFSYGVVTSRIQSMADKSCDGA